VKDLVAFFLLAYGFAWTGFWLMSLGSGAAGLLVTFAPALAAVILSYRENRWQGVRDTLRPLLRWRASIWLYLFIAAWYPLARFAALYLAHQFQGEPYTFEAMTVPTAVLGFIVGGVLGGPLGEEIGWRGFALPRLDARLAPFPSALLLGVIWACWHLPAFYLAGTDQFNKPFLPYFALVMAFSVILAQLWRATQSILLCALQHRVINFSLFMASAGVSGRGVWALQAPAYMLYLIPLTWLVAIATLWWLPAKRATAIAA
jgi:uncharacterized protein